MSIPFSDPATKKGLIQLIEDDVGFDDGTITGDTVLFQKFTASINIAIDYIYAKIFEICGWRWEMDDTNQSTTEGYPTVTANLVSGTRIYAFTVDAASNVILDIRKVLVAGPDGIYRELTPIDIQVPGSDSQNFTDGASHPGTPTRYNKTGKYIAFDVTPNYSVTNGIKLIVSREGTYFTTASTTAVPGIPVYQEFFVKRPAAQYASRKTLDNAQNLWNQAIDLENSILAYFGRRGKDERPRLGVSTKSADSNR